MFGFLNFLIFIDLIDFEIFECLFVDGMIFDGRLIYLGIEVIVILIGVFLILFLFGRINVFFVGIGILDGLIFVIGSIGIFEGRGGCLIVGGKMDDVLMFFFDVFFLGGGGGNGIFVGKIGSDVDWGIGIFGGG